MPLKRLFPSADDALTQDTEFSRDALGRYVCNQRLHLANAAQGDYDRIGENLIAHLRSSRHRRPTR